MTEMQRLKFGTNPVIIAIILVLLVTNPMFFYYKMIGGTIENDHCSQTYMATLSSGGFPAPNKVHGDPTLEQLSGNPTIGSISCLVPLVPIYDRIVNTAGLAHVVPNRKIPRTIHVSMKSRCMPPDISNAMTAWKEALPYHSFYFHDDDAVDRLFQLEWKEFPHVNNMLRCVRFKGAMKIDVWRILIIYKYGGIYTDIDMIPGELLSEISPIQPDDEAVFLSDSWNRPSQWFFAMEPNHPVAYYTMFEIFKRLQDLTNIEKPKVVFVTGPDALKHGYGAALGWKGGDNIWDFGTHPCKFGKTVTKIPQGVKGEMYVDRLDLGSIVAWNATENVTMKERIERQHGVVHWTKQAYKKKVEFHGTCLDFLYTLDHGLNLSKVFV